MQLFTACWRPSAGGSDRCGRHHRPSRLDGDRRYLKGGGGSAAAQQPINYQALGQQQLQTNVGTAENQAQLNNLNTFSPYGSTVFAPGQIDPNTGMPSSYNVTQSLSAPFQNLFNTQTALAQSVAAGGQPFAAAAPTLAGYGTGLLGQGAGWARQLPQNIDLSNVQNVGYLTPSSFQTNITTGAGGQPLPGVQTGFNTNFIPGLVGQAQDAAYRSQTQYLDPQFSQAQEQLKQQLNDQGVQEGSHAYTQAMGDFGRQQQQAYSNAGMNAVAAGNAQEQALYGQALQGGEFANNAQNQMFTQGGALANLFNQAVLGASQQDLAAQTGNLSRAQAAFQAPYSAAQGVTGIGQQMFGTGLSGLSGVLPSITAWPSGASGIPNLAPGGMNYVSPTNLSQAAQAATQANTAGFNMGQTQLGNLIGGANLASRAFGGGGLFGGGGGAGGGGLFSSGGFFGSQGPLFGTAADASIAAGGAPLALDATGAAAGGGGLFSAIGSALAAF